MRLETSLQPRVKLSAAAEIHRARRKMGVATLRTWRTVGRMYSFNTEAKNCHFVPFSYAFIHSTNIPTTAHSSLTTRVINKVFSTEASSINMYIDWWGWFVSPEDMHNQSPQRCSLPNWTGWPQTVSAADQKADKTLTYGSSSDFHKAGDLPVGIKRVKTICIILDAPCATFITLATSHGMVYLSGNLQTPAFNFCYGQQQQKTYCHQSDSGPFSESTDTLHCSISYWNILWKKKKKVRKPRKPRIHHRQRQYFFKLFLLAFKGDTSTVLPN